MSTQEEMKSELAQTLGVIKSFSRDLRSAVQAVGTMDLDAYEEKLRLEEEVKLDAMCGPPRPDSPWARSSD